MEVLRTIFDGPTSFVLRRNGSALELVLGNVVLLSSAALETEREFGRLARLVSPHAAGPPAPIVIGGLGFGATLRGSLDVASPETRITVVEKLRPVIALAREEGAELVAGALDDPRVTLHEGDIVEMIASAAPASLGALLLDVDNGPEWASFRSNARLYGDDGLRRAHRALAPGGVFAVWSGYPRDAFLQALRRVGFAAKIEPLRERGVVRARAYLGIVK